MLYCYFRNNLLESLDFCDCCSLPLPHKGLVEKYSLFTSSKSLTKVSPGLFFYFFYIKTTIIVLALYSIFFHFSFNEIGNYALTVIHSNCDMLKKIKNEGFNQTYFNELQILEMKIDYVKIRAVKKYYETLEDICYKIEYTGDMFYDLSSDCVYDYLSLLNAHDQDKKENLIEKAMNITKEYFNVTFNIGLNESSKDNNYDDIFNDNNTSITTLSTKASAGSKYYSNFNHINFSQIEQMNRNDDFVDKEYYSNIKEDNHFFTDPEKRTVIYNNYSYYLNSMTLIFLFLNYLLIGLFYNMTIEADIETISPSDYALIISNVPESLLNLPDESLMKVFSATGITPLNIIRTFKLEKYIDLKTQFYETVKKLLIVRKNKQEYFTESSYLLFKKQLSLDDLNKELIQVKDELLEFIETNYLKVDDDNMDKNNDNNNYIDKTTSDNNNEDNEDEEKEKIINNNHMTQVLLLLFNSQKECSDFKDRFYDSYFKVMKKNLMIMYNEFQTTSEIIQKKVVKSIKTSSVLVKDKTKKILNTLTLGRINILNDDNAMLNILTRRKSKFENNSNTLDIANKQRQLSKLSIRSNSIRSSKNKTISKDVDDAFAKGEIKLTDLQHIIVEEAPEPTDIIWENLEYSRFSQLTRACVVYIISFILIVVSFYIILYISYIQVSLLYLYFLLL